VILMMENHSFDNYFGTLGHGEGFPRDEDGCWGPANLAADGSDSERYVARAGDACFDHLLRAAHGLFTVDRTRTDCS